MPNRFIFTNFMVGELLDNILAISTEIRLSPSITAKLQAFSAVDELEARFALWNGQNDPEIVGCTANPQNGTLTVTRGEEGTTARAWPAGTQVRCVLTAAVINQALLASVDTEALLAATYLPLVGGTVSGPIVLPGTDPTLANHAARKSYVDSVQGNKLPIGGGTMAGSINMNSNRILALPAAVASTEPSRKAELDALALEHENTFHDRSGALSTAGSATAFTVTTTTGFTALEDGMTVRAKLHASMGDSATLQVDTTDAKPIHRTPGTVVSAGDGLSGVPYDFTYVLSLDAWLIVGALQEWETGDIKTTIRATVGAGWRMMDDGTIGDATSAATYANDNARALFLVLWNSVSDTYAPVVTGRGASAAADWAAHKKITLTKVLGRALAVAGAGAGLTARTLGLTVGEETHVLLEAELATHTHVTNVTDAGHVHPIQYAPNSADAPGTFANIGALDTGASFSNTDSATTGITVANEDTGSDAAHNNMQPTSFLNVAIHL